MTATRTRQQIGKANAAKGKTAEQATARLFRENGFPACERTVRTGYRTADRVSRDAGDLHPEPRIVVQVKNTAREDPAGWLHEAAEQAITAVADLGIVVHRRTGKADPARWWAWVHTNDLVWLHAHALGLGDLAPLLESNVPVRLELGDLLPLLRAAGYGQGSTETEAG